MALPTDSFQFHWTLTRVGPVRTESAPRWEEGKAPRGPKFSFILQLRLSKMVATCYDSAPEVWPVSRLRSHIHCIELFLGLGQVESIYSPSTREMEAGELEVQGQS